MEIPEFLEFERKKAILPAILVVLLTFVLVYDALYYEEISKRTHEIGDKHLESLKLILYNESLNGSDKEIENKLVDLWGKAGYGSQTLFLPYAPLYISEYITNTFGTNFCSEAFLSVSEKSECYGTKTDLILHAELFRLSSCAEKFVISRENFLEIPGTDHLTEDIIEKNKEFVYSERGQNIFNEFEECSYSLDTFLNTKPEELSNEILLLSSPKVPKMKLIDSVYISLYYVILFSIGYLVSSIFLLLHRKNVCLRGRRKRIYAEFAILFLLFIYIFFPIIVIYLTYAIFHVVISDWTISFNNVKDFRIIFVFVIILSYAVLTICYKIKDLVKERSIVRRIKKSTRK